MSPKQKAVSGSPAAGRAAAKPKAPEAEVAAPEVGAEAAAAEDDVAPEPGAAPEPDVAHEDPAEPEVVFTYRSAGGAVAIFWRGRQVKTVGGAVGASLRRKLGEADAATTQALLARASGKFKRGTEHQR